jgi:hypothetical protein
MLWKIVKIDQKNAGAFMALAGAIKNPSEQKGVTDDFRSPLIKYLSRKI